MIVSDKRTKWIDDDSSLNCFISTTEDTDKETDTRKHQWDPWS